MILSVEPNKLLGLRVKTAQELDALLKLIHPVCFTAGLYQGYCGLLQHPDETNLTSP